DQNEHAIGIVLSGSGSDGTLGVKAIKEHGGLTFAQGADGTAARHSSMAESAIASGPVDLAASVVALPKQAIAHSSSFNILGKGAEDEKEAEDLRRDICTILLDQTGHDFSGYKTRTFYRRLERRMQVLQLTTLKAYADVLRNDAAEVSTLFRDLLIGVTNFFRDTKAFEALQGSVIPQLFEGKRAQDTIRVWVPGCATGEEVYSIAILLREHVDKVTPKPKMQLFATDIDEAGLAVARGRRHPRTLLDCVSTE